MVCVCLCGYMHIGLFKSLSIFQFGGLLFKILDWAEGLAHIQLCAHTTDTDTQPNMHRLETRYGAFFIFKCNSLPLDVSCEPSYPSGLFTIEKPLHHWRAILADHFFSL